MTIFVQSLLLALFISCCLMFLTWVISIRIHNAGIVDIAWAFGFTLLIILYGSMAGGYGPRRLLIIAMVILWSLRLSVHIFMRVLKDHPIEDGRYQKIRNQWSINSNKKFFCFFQFQAILLVLLSVPFLLSCLNPYPKLSFLEWFALGIWVVALLGESIADDQLRQFKLEPSNKGKVCQVGLWYFSRHPNYFFEWLNWCAYFLFALASPYGSLTVYCPLLMLYFLLKVTGVRLTEQQAVQTKGDAYRDYQNTTSAFIPWFRKAIK